MSQSLHLNGGSHPAALHGVGFHEFHPGRGVVEQIPNQDGGAVRASGLGFLGDDPGIQMQLYPGQASRRFGHQIDPADGGNGSQCLAPEAHGADGGQVFLRAQLGGGVAQKGGAGVLDGHAAAVVRHPEKGHAPVPDFDGHLGGSRVHGVFQQFLDGAGWPLHHLTGGNQVGHMGR